MGTQVIISTRRLRLRTWRHSDSKQFDKVLNTGSVMKWLGGCSSQAQVQREVDWYIRHFKRHGHCFFAIETRNKTFVGFCGLIRVGEVVSPIRGKLEIGWRVGQEFWRRGYALEASRAVLEWAATRLPDDVVFARINVRNEPSAALARKLGMRRLPGGDHVHPSDGMHLATYAFNCR